MERQLHKSLVAEDNFNRQVANDVKAFLVFDFVCIVLGVTNIIPIVMLTAAFFAAVVIVMVRVFGHRQVFFKALTSPMKQ